MKFLYAYRSIAIPANVVSVIAWIYAVDVESPSEMFTLFWMKAVTLAFTIAFIYIFNRQLVFFYMNLGIGERLLYISMVAIDLAIFVTGIAIIYIIL
jgi:hypothetical protein